MGFFTAPAAQADGSASLEVYAVGTAQNGAACVAGSGSAALVLPGRAHSPRWGISPGWSLRIRLKSRSPSPGTQSPEVPSEAGNDDPDNKVDVTLNSDGSFEYIYDTSGVQQVDRHCIYPDGNVASTSTEVNATCPLKPALSASEQRAESSTLAGPLSFRSGDLRLA